MAGVKGAKTTKLGSDSFANNIGHNGGHFINGFAGGLIAKKTPWTMGLSAMIGDFTASEFRKAHLQAFGDNGKLVDVDTYQEAVSRGERYEQLAAGLMATMFGQEPNTAAAFIAAMENSYGAYFPVLHMNEQVDLEEVEEDLEVLEKVSQALRNMAGLREDVRQGRSQNLNASGAMVKKR